MSSISSQLKPYPIIYPHLLSSSQTSPSIAMTAYISQCRHDTLILALALHISGLTYLFTCVDAYMLPSQTGSALNLNPCLHLFLICKIVSNSHIGNDVTELGEQTMFGAQHAATTAISEHAFT